MRRNIACSPATKGAGLRSVIVFAISSWCAGGFIDRSHRILEGTTSREMLAAANPALDFLVFKLVFDAPLLAGLLGLLRLRLPVHAGSENDIFTNGCSIEGWSGRVAFLDAELRPCPALRNLRINMFLHNGGANPTGHLDLLPIVVETVGYECLRSILVGEYLLCGELIGVFIGPVGTAVIKEQTRISGCKPRFSYFYSRKIALSLT
jgi:hypothetical protein